MIVYDVVTLGEKTLRACSHEPGELPWGNECPGASVTLRSHDNLLSPGNVNFIAPGQVEGHLIITKLSEFLYFSHKLLQRRNFKHFYPFLVLSGTFFEKFISNSNNEHAQVYSCPGATLAFCSHGVKLPRRGGLPVSRSCPWATKISCEQLQVSDRAPRQSWPRGQWVAPGQWVVLGSCEQALLRVTNKLM